MTDKKIYAQQIKTNSLEEKPITSRYIENISSYSKASVDLNAIKENQSINIESNSKFNDYIKRPIQKQSIQREGDERPIRGMPVEQI